MARPWARPPCGPSYSAARLRWTCRLRNNGCRRRSTRSERASAPAADPTAPRSPHPRARPSERHGLPLTRTKHFALPRVLGQRVSAPAHVVPRRWPRSSGPDGPSEWSAPGRNHRHGSSRALAMSGPEGHVAHRPGSLRLGPPPEPRGFRPETNVQAPRSRGTFGPSAPAGCSYHTAQPTVYPLTPSSHLERVLRRVTNACSMPYALIRR